MTRMIARKRSMSPVNIKKRLPFVVVDVIPGDYPVAASPLAACSESKTTMNSTEVVDFGDRAVEPAGRSVGAFATKCEQQVDNDFLTHDDSHGDVGCDHVRNAGDWPVWDAVLEGEKDEEEVW